LAHCKKELKLWRLGPPKLKIFYGKMEYLAFWPTDIGEKGRTDLGQNIWD
jgi:hypothetical protein